MSNAKSRASSSHPIDPRLPKLVRDKIPQLIIASGQQPRVSTIPADKVQVFLETKLQEELDEYIENHDISELGDMLEVIYTLAELRHASPEQLEDIRRTKRTERGGFDSHLLLESVT